MALNKERVLCRTEQRTDMILTEELKRLKERERERKQAVQSETLTHL